MSESIRGSLYLSLLAGLMFGITFGIAGCSSSQALPPSGNHPPTTPDRIMLYQKAPKKYEQLGYVQTTENVQWGKDFDVAPIVDALKAKAAAMGATGLLLDAPPDPGEKLVSAYGTYRGKSYHFSGTQQPQKKVKAVAIYVVEP